MKLFVESAHCLNHGGCATCRDKEGGRRWRESFVRAGFVLPADAVDFECPFGLPWGEGGAAVQSSGPAPAPLQPRPKPWPMLAQLIAAKRQPQDRGLGDTISRVLEPKGGKLFKRLYKRITGGDCGCSDRASRLNALYPY